MKKEYANPFNPSFGRIPPIYIERESDVFKLCSEFENINSPYQTTMIYAQRGSGKTVFMAEVCQEMQKKDDWIVVKLPSEGQILLDMVQQLYDKCASDLRKTIEKIDSFQFSILGTGFGLTRSQAEPNYYILLSKMFDELKKKNLKVLISIDEVELNEDIKSFIRTYKLLMEQNYHITLLMAGLPQNINSVQHAKGFTFLLRSQKWELDSLTIPTIKWKYQQAFKNTERIVSQSEALVNMAKQTKGYAYAFQLLGFIVWKADDLEITCKTVEDSLDEYKAMLFSNAYEAIVSELSQLDVAFIKGMAQSMKDDETAKMEDIAGLIGKTTKDLSMQRKRLIDSRIIAQASFGHLEFMLPYFCEYILEYL